MSKQSSVEYFIYGMASLLGEFENKSLPQERIMDLYEQAKAIHKEETTITENTSDGYHTFKELYEIRKAYNVALFNEWASQLIVEKKVGGAIVESLGKYNIHKSWKHHDGELCFGGGWFIVVAILPTGQITNHYKAEDWDLFKIPEVEKALFPYDGHTTEDVIHRLLTLL
jgi:hypothetical protein